MYWLLKKTVPIPDLTKYDSYLFVGPHPDDIELGCGGAVTTLVASGKRIKFVIATNGCVGSIDQSIDKQNLISLRQKETVAAAKLLGVEDVSFLPFDDGGDYTENEMSREIAKVILEFCPDVVFAPDSRCRSEYHPDHLKVGNAVTNTFFFCEWKKQTEKLGVDKTHATKCLALYFTDKPNAYIKVKSFEQKIAALRCHKSQFTSRDIEALLPYFSIRNVRYHDKEAFRAMTPTHMHCFPEGSEF